MRAMARIFVTRELPGPALARLKEAHETTVWPEPLPPSYEQLREHAAGAEALLTLLTDRVDAELIAAAPQPAGDRQLRGRLRQHRRRCRHRARHPGRQHARRADRGHRRSGLRAADGRRPPDPGGGGVRPQRPVADLGAGQLPRRRRLRRDARDHRPGPHRPGRRPPRHRLRHGGADHRDARPAQPRAPAAPLRLRLDPPAAHRAARAT